MNSAYASWRKIAAAPLAACLLALAFAGAAAAADYPNTANFGIAYDKNARWHQLCMEAKDARPPAADAAGPAEKGCDPRDMYYDARSGAGASVGQWRAVRACAQAAGDDSVLMMLYANGLGVGRDLRLATRYACRMGGAMLEVQGRVEHLARLQREAAADKPAEDFDLCDDVTSGYMLGECAAIASRQADARREARMDSIAARLTTEQGKAWERLLDAADAFSEARGDHETNLLGTARAAMAIEAKDAEADWFVELLERCEQGKLPTAGAAKAAEQDRRLNDAYRAIMRVDTEGEGKGMGLSTVTKADVQAAQRLWVRFRDAWTAFAHARYPSVPAHAWNALLTERRAGQLEELLAMAEEAD
jgi:uncharacterized protein YecT (DUF1311 family)